MAASSVFVIGRPDDADDDCCLDRGRLRPVEELLGVTMLVFAAAVFLLTVLGRDLRKSGFVVELFLAGRFLVVAGVAHLVEDFSFAEDGLSVIGRGFVFVVERAPLSAGRTSFCFLGFALSLGFAVSFSTRPLLTSTSISPSGLKRAITLFRIGGLTFCRRDCII